MILVLGGTSDSIGICNLLNQRQLDYTVSVTTAYGEKLAKQCTDKVILKKLTLKDMVDYIKKNNVTKIIDSTHPYAVEVSTNAIEASQITNINYIRFERESNIKKINFKRYGRLYKEK